MDTFTPLQAEASLLAAELLKLADTRWPGYDTWTEAPTSFLDVPRVREIGEQLNRLGGFELMATISFAVSQLLSAGESGLALAFNTDINHAWNGIGTWQS